MSVTSPRKRPFSRWSLAAVTATAMGVATFGQSAFGILASNLIDEFEVERWQIGILVSAMGFTGAGLSPVFGLVDGCRDCGWAKPPTTASSIILNRVPTCRGGQVDPR